MKKQVFFSLIFIIYSSSEFSLSHETGSNILFVPIQQKAYLMENLVIVEEILSRGNNITVSLVIGSQFYGTVKKLLPETLKIYQFHQTPNRMYAHNINGVFADVVNSGERIDGPEFHPKLAGIVDVIPDDCLDMWVDKNFLNTLRDESFDVAYVDVAMHFLACPLLLPYNLSIPIIAHMPHYLPWIIRVPALPSFVPVFGATDRMSFVDRLKNLFVYFAMEYISSISDKTGNLTILAQYAPRFTNWKDLLRKCQLFIINADHVLNYPMPKMPNTVLISGITFKEASRNLPKEIESVVKTSEKGVILASFGSLFNELSPRFVDKFMAAFSQLIDYTVIYSYGGDISQLKNIPKHVRVFKWVPQNELLGHENTKLFVNHGGQRGQLEAVYHGVPMITLGVQREQVQNALKMTNKGFGLHVDFYDFTPDELARAMNEVLSNPMYSINIQKASAMLKDSEPHPKELVVNWIEHILQFGGDHLRSYAMDMSLYEFLMLDVLLLVLFIAIVIVLLFVGFGKLFYKCFVNHCWRKHKEKLKKN